MANFSRMDIFPTPFVINACMCVWVALTHLFFTTNRLLTPAVIFTTTKIKKENLKPCERSRAESGELVEPYTELMYSSNGYPTALAVS